MRAYMRGIYRGIVPSVSIKIMSLQWISRSSVMYLVYMLIYLPIPIILSITHVSHFSVLKGHVWSSLSQHHHSPQAPIASQEFCLEDDKV